jgi:uncharacterized protein (TIGR02996 family)
MRRSPDEIHADFLAAIYAAPENDEPRLVYMDWLLERGNPRGRFLALQFERHRAGELSNKDRRKESELLRQKRDEWLGPAAGLVDGTPVFARGFLHAATLRDDPKIDPESARAPAFSTMVEVSGAPEPLRVFLSIDADAGGLRSNLRALRTAVPDDLQCATLPTWMKLLPQLGDLTEIRFRSGSLVRRGQELLLHLETHLLGGHWLAALEGIDGQGWTLELGSYRYTDRGRKDDAVIASRLASQYPSFRHVLVVGTPDQRRY